MKSQDRLHERLTQLFSSSSGVEIQHLHVSLTFTIRFVIHRSTAADLDTSVHVCKGGNTRDHRILWQPWGWEVVVLLETAAATRIRTSQPRHSQDCRFLTGSWLARGVHCLYSSSNMLKQREKCIKVATTLVESGTSVVIGRLIRDLSYSPFTKLTVPDNTNADLDTRAVWVALAQRLNVGIRCVLFTAPPKLCEHNDVFRALNVGPEVSFTAPMPPIGGLRTIFANYSTLFVEQLS